MTLSVGLGDDISANAIIGLPIFREWNIVLDVDDKKAASKTLNQYFDLLFQHAASSLPANIIFKKEDFVQPPRHNPIGTALVTQLAVSIVKTIIVTSHNDDGPLVLAQSQDINSNPPPSHSE